MRFSVFPVNFGRNRRPGDSPSTGKTMASLKSRLCAAVAMAVALSGCQSTMQTMQTPQVSTASSAVEVSPDIRRILTAGGLDASAPAATKAQIAAGTAATPSSPVIASTPPIPSADVVPVGPKTLAYADNGQTRRIKGKPTAEDAAALSAPLPLVAAQPLPTGPLDSTQVSQPAPQTAAPQVASTPTSYNFLTGVGQEAAQHPAHPTNAALETTPSAGEPLIAASAAAAGQPLITPESLMRPVHAGHAQAPRHARPDRGDRPERVAAVPRAPRPSEVAPPSEPPIDLSKPAVRRF